jgi:uncharacterized protein YsxB (DUF464 family)
MITAVAVVDSSSCLIRLDVTGHADFSKTGEDIVCSAVSILIRTAGRVLLSRFGKQCCVALDEKGSFKLEVLKISDGRREWMKGITEFLLNGLSDLEKDYSAFVNLEITNNEEINHGS